MKGSALTLLFAAFLVAGVQGHGWLSYPEARNSRARGLPTTPADVAYKSEADNGRASWIQAQEPSRPLDIRVGQPGVCGDPFQDVTDRSVANYFASTPMAATTFTAGQRVSFRWAISMNHGGFFRFKICPQRTGLTQACFDANTLQRADGLGTRTYLLSTMRKTPQLFPMWEYSTPEYIIPANINCAGGCVLQSEYHTLNSCSMLCENSAQCIGNGLNYNNYANPVHNLARMSDCNMRSDSTWGYGERFHNCADIIITGGGGSGPTPPGPAPPSPPPPSGCRAFAPSGGACSASVCCPNRECCSRGFCGTTADHCSGSITPPPPSVCTRTAASGGACGAAAGGACCPSGQCCSQHGFCGTTSGHCGTGCQRTFGSCVGARAARRARRQGPTNTTAANTTTTATLDTAAAPEAPGAIAAAAVAAVPADVAAATATPMDTAAAAAVAAPVDATVAGDAAAAPGSEAAASPAPSP